MTALSDLRFQAMSSAGFRGHILFWHYPAKRSEFRETQIGRCSICGKEATINTNPQPNEIDIGGEAVSLNCKSA